MGRLDERVAIVTGGAQGIGAAYAKGLAAEGARVVIADVNSGADVVGEIEATGGTALDVITDVSDGAACEAMVARTVETFGRVDILVNNAAVFAKIGQKPFMDIGLEEWDTVMAVNIRGVFLCCKAATPQMRKQGYGKIINITTGRIFKGMPDFLQYDAAKGAVLAMTRVLARELGDHNICVNSIAPGGVLSDGVLSNPDLANRIAMGVERRTFKRQQEPEDLVGACVFLASAESDFVTGQTLVVDGGSAMH